MKCGIVAPGFRGHLNPATTVGCALVRRGHTVCLISTPEGEPIANRLGLEFCPISVQEFQSEDLANDKETLARLEGIEAFQFNVHIVAKAASDTYRDLPPILKSERFDALLIDDTCPAAISLARIFDIPFGTLAATPPQLQDDNSVPPFITTWGPAGNSLLLRSRNWLARKTLFQLMAEPVLRVIRDYNQQHGMSPVILDPKNIGLIQLTQLPACFEFPRDPPADHFLYTSPWYESNRDSAIEFPWDKLDGRPLLYVSLGTTQNRIEKIYKNLVQACRGLDSVQLVLALGRENASLDVDCLPKGAIVVGYAPQLQLLQKASAIVSHCGLNTALEAISYGLPIVAVPLTNDQPGVAVSKMFQNGSCVIHRLLW
mmetsp:Transcript_18065/g.49224  ORF Transcript_18065/g.49224 Transcript_18065/m.49224 type:complete len:372 (-) Transcript_18065:359-1474(-)